jgi:hypothetical protein
MPQVTVVDELFGTHSLRDRLDDRDIAELITAYPRQAERTW